MAIYKFTLSSNALTCSFVPDITCSCAIGNKTQCDICSSKAMRKARLKKEQKDATLADPSEVPDEQPAPAHHHTTHDEGILKSTKLGKKKQTNPFPCF